MGGLLPHFLCSKLRVLTICYRLENLYLSILGLSTYIERKNKIDRAQRDLRMVYFSRQSAQKVQNRPYLKNRVSIIEISQKLACKSSLATETLL